MKTKHTLFAILSIICFSSVLGQIPKTEWISASTGEGNAATVAIATDSIGNIYQAGSYRGIRNFGTAAANVTITSTNYVAGGGNDDVFVSKFDNDGNLIWIFSVGSNQADKVTDLELDKNGDLFIAGQFNGSRMDLDPGPDSSFVEGNSNQRKPFLLKVSNDGDFIWGNSPVSKTWIGFYQAIAIDDTGNVYLTSSFSDRADFDPDTSEYILTETTLGEFFVQKLDRYGNFEWVKSMPGNQSGIGRSILIDSNGSILIAGQFQGSMDFDPGPDSLILTTERIVNPHVDGFVVKLTSSGDLIWAKGLGWNNIPEKISIDKSGKIKVIRNGIFETYSPNGIYESSFNIGVGRSLRAFVEDSGGNTYITGEFQGTYDFDPGPDMLLFQSISDKDIFIVKYNSTGEFVWAQVIGSLFFESAPSITLDHKQDLMIGGFFQGKIYFKPEGFTFENDPPGVKSNFLIKISESWATSLEESEQFSHLKIYPNPVNKVLNIDHDNIPLEQVQILDLRGKIILSNSYPNREINLESLARGIYIIRFSSEGKTFSRKFIKD